MENGDDENGTAPDLASNQFEFSWYDYSGNHKTFRFTGNEGIQVDLAKNLTPVAAFDQFFSPELIALIVEETNRYAAYIISTTNVTRKSRLNQWYPTNEQEIRKFVGFYIWMGLNCRPAIASYWSTDVLYKNQVSQVLSRNRFEMLLRMIHFSDRENETNNDRLYKIRPVLDMLNNSFQQTYTVGQEMVINESMIPWRGRLKFRQYIPTKSHKYGAKLFKLCSPSGYTWKCQIYTGRTEEQRPAGLGIGETVVLTLTEGLLNEGRTLYTDNFYTSCPLAKILLTKSTHLVGTLRRSRKHLPKDVKTKKLKKHEYIGQQTNDGMVVSKFKDARDVLMLSTLHGLEMKVSPPSSELKRAMSPTANNDEPNRKKKRVNEAAKLKPEAIIAYNNGKEDVARTLLFGNDANRKSLMIPKVAHLFENTDEKTRKQCRTCYFNLTKEMSRAEARKKVRKVRTYCDGCDGKPAMCQECHIKNHSS
ncbi:hypothetical protein JTB14_014176 [Gonioctena quinquepunctata]|nr:hypothetical protein JTB14_014176 [Gonioctena quinquepunctata]